METIPLGVGYDSPSAGRSPLGDDRMVGIEQVDTEILKRYLAEWPKPIKVHPARDVFVHEPLLIPIETPNGQVSVRRSDIIAELRRRGENVE